MFGINLLNNSHLMDDAQVFYEIKMVGLIFLNIILFHSLHLFMCLFILHKTLPSPAPQQPERRPVKIGINMLKGHSTCFPTLRSV